ncbi:MAG: AraC family transcriptional regulator, partial [Nevskiales bacterium]
VKAGVDTNAVYFQIGFKPEYLNKPELRTPHDAQIGFWEAVETVTGDPDIGLHLAPHIPLYRGDVFEYLFLSSPNFREGCRRAMRYSRLFSDALMGSLNEDDEGPARVALAVTQHKHPVLRHTEICIAYGLIEFCKSVTDGAFKAERISLCAAKPKNPAAYVKAFGCPVEFDSAESFIYFDRALLDRPSPHSEPEFLRVHEEVASRQLTKLESRDVVEAVKRVLAQGLEYQSCDLESVAKQLGRTPRRLRQELTRAGTSFNQVLGDFRFTMARRLLAGTDEPIDRIVYLTGFAEVSTFYRAFRRWAGKTPVQYRQEKQKKRKQVGVGAES